MDPYSKDQILSFYNFHLKKFGDRPEALRWTPQGQLKRYHMLADIAPARDLNNSTVLDYGCGTGDFYKFLKRRDINVKYTGARRIFPRASSALYRATPAYPAS